MSSLDYLDLCRLCLVKDGVSVPIFEGETFLKISACLPVKVTREDKLPKKICHDCVCKVELFYDFCNTTANSEKQLLQLLGDVHMEDDKQNYIETVLSPNRMKSDEGGKNNRLEDTVMQQVSEHQNSMNIMDNIMDMPMMISGTTQQQITSVPMDTTGESVQNVPVAGPSTQMTHEQVHINQNQSDTPMQQEEEEESSEEEENFEEECDADEGLPVKEESEEDPNNRRTVEPTTFVNVSLTCEEAGPSGLQQQKIPDIPDTMVLPQTEDVDPKTGEENCSKKVLRTDDSGCFIVGKDSVPMRLYQHIDADGKPHYSLVPKLENVATAEKDVSVQLLTPVNVKTEDRSSNQITVRRSVGSITEPSTTPCKTGSFACDRCNMKFPTHPMLNRHKITHTMRYCIFEQQRVIKTRKRKRMEGVTEKTEKTQKKKFNCASCNYKCSSEKDLENHTCGKNETSYVCDVCDYECKRSTTLATHVAQFHSKKSEKSSNADKRRVTSHRKSALALSRENSDTITVVKEEICLEEDDASRNAVDVPAEPAGQTSFMRCDRCDFKCTNKSTLYSHKQRRHRKRARPAVVSTEVYSCNECSFKTTKKSSLSSHMYRKHREPPGGVNAQPELFQCNQCDYKNKNKYELKIHVARKHTEDFKYSCETCGKRYKVKGDLTNHIRFNHREQPVICDVCGKTCLNSNSLYVHQKFAHYKAKYECHLCKRRMVSQENLNEHMLRQHERRENVVCEECGKTFSRNSRLKVHMRIHTGDKPYSCTICTKSFARRTALKQHLLIHTGIRPYVCDICGKAFTQKPGLISHRKSHPGPHPPLPRVLIDHILSNVMNNT